MSSIRFGFIGAGQIASSSAAAVNSHPEGKVIAIQDLSTERVAELAKQQNIPHQYAKVEDLLANSEVDAVYIAVPNRFHVPLAIQALEAGKHVILEKPFAMSFEEAQKAAAAAKAAGKVLTLGMNQRFDARSQKLRSIVKTGALGEIYHAKACWFRRTGIPRLGTWFGNKELAGGGCLYDIGVHLLDLTLFVLDDFKPVSVFGATYTKFGNRGLGEGGWGMSERENITFDVEDFASGLIRMANGSTISLDVTWACHTDTANKADVQLYGTEAGAKVFAEEIYRRNAETGDYIVTQGLNGSVEFEARDRFHNFINHLNGTERLCVSLEEALVVQRILDGLMESSITGREVRLD